jgi:hypothetical protein
MGNNPISLTDPDGGSTQCEGCPGKGTTNDPYQLQEVVIRTRTRNASGFSDNSLWRYTPGFGSGLDAYDAFARGDYWTGAFHSALAITDIASLGAGSLATGGLKAAVKVGATEVAEEAAEQLTKRAISNLRQKAVRQAWKQEKNLIKTTGAGTRDWTEAEAKQLLKNGKVKGYQGHHITSVKKAILDGQHSLISNPANIEFVTRAEHLSAHGGNFKNLTIGALINR